MIKKYSEERKIFHRYISGSIDREQADSLYTRILVDVSKLDLNRSIPPSPSKKILLYKLPQKSLLKLSDCLKVFLIILRTRGLLRWLSLNLFADEITGLDQVYFLSRLEIVKKLATNRKLAVVIIRKHLRYTNEVDFTTDLTRISLNDYMRALSIGKIEIPEKCILTCKSKFRFRSKNINTFPKIIPTLGKVDAHSLLDFLREFGPGQSIYNYLELYDQRGWEYLNSTKKLFVKRLENSVKTFDDLMTSFGSEYSGEILTNIDIWHQRFLVQNGTLLEFDVTGSHLVPFVAGHWQYLSASKLSPDVTFLEKPEKSSPQMDEAIFLSGRADENWYHLLLDTLPRYMFLKDLPKDIPVLVRNDLPPTSLEFLKRMIDRQVIELPENSRVNVKKLYFIAARSTVFDSVSPNAEPELHFSPKVLAAMANWIKEKKEIRPSESSQEILYFKRRSRQRRIINAHRVEQLTSKLGFEIIEDNAQLYNSQVKIFSNLSIGVSPGGAILANMIFMRRGSTLVCLRSSRQSELALWKNLAQIFGINYVDVVGIPTYFGKNPLRSIHSNFYILPKKLRKTLGEVIQAKT